MKVRVSVLSLFLSPALCCGLVAVARSQDQEPDTVFIGSPVGQESGSEPRGTRAAGHGVFGKITAIQGDSIEITGSDGNKVTLKLTSGTEFRKDRQPAKLSDFKVGDQVVVRTDQANGNPATALMVAGGQGFAMRGGPGGPGRPGAAGGPLMMSGTLGKDYVLGEVKAVDPPKLTVLRTDNVTQTLELNEETSLRRGRDSITMPDIQAGDHVFARGALENNVFVPKNLNVIPPEMWKRMQEMNAGGGPAAPGAPNAPAEAPSPKSPPEPQH